MSTSVSGGDVRRVGQGGSRSRKRRRVALGVFALLVALLATGAIAWPASASSARGAVVIGVDAAPWVCRSGTTTTTAVGDDDEPEYASLAVVTKNMRCQLRVLVENTGPRRVRVDEVTFGALGPGSALNVAATQLDGSFSTVLPAASRKSGASAVDAAFRIPEGLIIQPRSTSLLRLTVVYRDKGAGCTLSAGSSESDLPVSIHLEALGLSGQRTSSSLPIGFEPPRGRCA